MRRIIVENPTYDSPNKLRQLLVQCESMASEALLRECGDARFWLENIAATAKKAWDTSDVVFRDIEE